MAPNSDYSEFDKLDTILQDQRLQDDKYGSWSSKTVKIAQGLSIYHAGVSLLRLLRNRYGNVSFGAAYARWRNGIESK